MKEVTKADIMIHPEDAPMLSQLGRSAASFGLFAENSPEADKHLKDGDEVTFGDITLKVMHTPGHSRGGICLYTDGHVFVGDTLFYGSIGRTDLPGGNYNTLISSIKEKLFTLPDNTVVHTGHVPETTILRELKTNPFLI